MTTMINPSFEEPWTDILSGPASVNQQPDGWELIWLEEDDVLWDSNDKATGVPECGHKGWFHNIGWNLPPNEQPDGSDPLILDGIRCYKIFSDHVTFGAQLRQVITGLEPGSPVTVFVPVRIHRHGDNDKWAAEAGLWVNGYGWWVHPPDKTWETIAVQGYADANGDVEILIRVKSKWALPKDFFLDNIQCECTAETEPPPPPPPSPGLSSVHRVLVYKDGSSEHIREDAFDENG